jgi:hypothetical protein
MGFGLQADGLWQIWSGLCQQTLGQGQAGIDAVGHEPNVLYCE